MFGIHFTATFQHNNSKNCNHYIHTIFQQFETGTFQLNSKKTAGSFCSNIFFKFIYFPLPSYTFAVTHPTIFQEITVSTNLSDQIYARALLSHQIIQNIISHSSTFFNLYPTSYILPYPILVLIEFIERAFSSYQICFYICQFRSLESRRKGYHWLLPTNLAQCAFKKFKNSDKIFLILKGDTVVLEFIEMAQYCYRL